MNEDINKLNLSDLGSQKNAEEEYFDKGERDLIMKNVNGRMSTSYSFLLRGFGKKKEAVNIKTGSTNIFSFYRSLLVREKRALERISLDPKFKKPKSYVHSKGRDIFKRPGH